ncbi:MAG: phosphonate C-P lyase system protein PhnG [Hyphomicrobiales bacterium]|nr:phosphonate C-P lyase system protein PhnG [Hyphomicrobiales bacterium]
MTETPPSPSPDAGPDDRRAVMTLAAAATGEELAAVRALAPAGVTDLRAPETGLVMVRGRMGGDGAPFNLGEATVTRAAVRLPSGTTGFGHLLGRDRARARDAAILDALWVEGRARDRLEIDVLSPIRRRLDAESAKLAAETGATRVDFFTLVRGDD